MEIDEDMCDYVSVSDSSPYRDILERIHVLNSERDWDQFHSPKNLTMNLGVETGELMEHFRWLTESESFAKSPQKLSEIRNEIGDVFLVLLHLTDLLGINLNQAAHDTLSKISKKYPIKQSKDCSKQYAATAPSPYKNILDQIIIFNAERDWDPFHSPKNLSMHLLAKTGELVKHFSWKTEAESFVRSTQELSEIRDKLGQVFLGLLHLAHVLGIEICQAAHDKLTEISKKYPVHQSKGCSKKYTELNGIINLNPEKIF